MENRFNGVATVDAGGEEEEEVEPEIEEGKDDVLFPINSDAEREAFEPRSRWFATHS